MEGGGHGLINTTLLARPGTRSSLGLSSCGLIHVYQLSVSFSYLRSAAGVSFDTKKARRRPHNTFYQDSASDERSYSWKTEFPCPYAILSTQKMRNTVHQGVRLIIMIAIYIRKENRQLVFTYSYSCHKQERHCIVQSEVLSTYVLLHFISSC